MWFGDLATMRWWDDLWLNESFATYVSNLALAEATRFDGAWRAFHADMKRWGYQADARSTTHPISGVVPDTDATFYNFDGITYGKGASVIKQLVAEIGHDAFRAGLRTYFRRHAWGNATLADFLAALEDGAGRPLRRLEPALAGDGLAQHDRGGLDGARRAGRAAPADPGGARGPPDAAPARARARARAGPPATGRPRSTSCRRASRAPRRGCEAAVGRPAPDLVFPNHGDHGYARVLLDPASLAAVPHVLAQVADPLLRQLLWGTLWEMVRSARHSSLAFLELVRTRLPERAGRPDPAGRRSTPSRVALARYVPEERRMDEARRFVAAALEALEGLPEGDLRTLWLRAAIGAAAEPADVAALAGVVDQEPGRPRRARWTARCAGPSPPWRWPTTCPGRAERVAAERAADPTDRGEREALRAEAGAPDPAVKAAAWERIHGEGYGSFHLTQAAMLGFNHAHQAALLAPYVERFFAALPAVAAERDHPFVRAYVTALFPAYRPEPGARRAHPRDGRRRRARELPSLRRLLLEAADDMERAVVCRSFASLRARGPS